MIRFYHVTSSSNRQSIETHGLDWKRMEAARGIAGSHTPEQDGCFLCLTESETTWFANMNNTGGTVDVWAVDGISDVDLIESPEGHFFLPRPIPPEQLELLQTDVPPRS